MNPSQLKPITTAKLIELRAMIDVEIAGRADGKVRIGSVVSFKARGGQKCWMRVDRVNRDTYGGVQCQADGSSVTAPMKWRAGKTLCTLVVVDAPVVTPVRLENAQRTTTAEQW